MQNTEPAPKPQIRNTDSDAEYGTRPKAADTICTEYGYGYGMRTLAPKPKYGYGYGYGYGHGHGYGYGYGIRSCLVYRLPLLSASSSSLSSATFIFIKSAVTTRIAAAANMASVRKIVPVQFMELAVDAAVDRMTEHARMRVSHHK